MLIAEPEAEELCDVVVAWRAFDRIREACMAGRQTAASSSRSQPAPVPDPDVCKCFSGHSRKGRVYQ